MATAAQKTYITIGALTLIIGLTILYASLGGKVALEVKCDAATFFVNNSGSFEKTGIERILLYNGSKQVPRSGCTLGTSRGGGITKFFKNSTYPGNITIIEEYTIDESNTDIIRFPTDHKVTILNARTYSMRYVASSLYYDGPTVHLVHSPVKFGKDMIVAWADHYDITDAWIVKNALGKGTLNINYNVSWEKMTYNMRLFDPPSVEFNATFCSSAHGFTGGTNTSCRP